jgi:hypothetical protein
LQDEFQVWQSGVEKWDKAQVKIGTDKFQIEKKISTYPEFPSLWMQKKTGESSQDKETFCIFLNYSQYVRAF